MTRFDADAEHLESAIDCDGPRALVLEAREVPLGGIRGMSVFRALPQRDLPMVGAWCFLDRFGERAVRMRVEPHPHIGLQTVTWPLLGVTRHRDTLGSDVIISRGELNLMTSGHGIAHSEYSLGEEAAPMDALQLWVALPESRRHGPPAFAQYTNLPTVDLGAGAHASVVVGSFAGALSPAEMHTPIVGAEIFLPARTRVRLPLDKLWEHAIVQVSGTVIVHAGPDESGDTTVPEMGLIYLGIHRDSIAVSAETDAVIFLAGGEPFDDEIVMWWNFVGRSHEEIVAARDEWEAHSPRFGGRIPGHGDERIPAPPLPAVRLTRRRRRV